MSDPEVTISQPLLPATRESRQGCLARILLRVISPFEDMCSLCLRPQILLVLVTLAAFSIVWWRNMLQIFVDETLSPRPLGLESQPRYQAGQYASGYQYILIWTDCFAVPNCGYHPGSGMFSGCKTKSCLMTSNRQLLSKAAIVVMHIRDLNNIIHDDLPPYHDPDQIWIFYTMENPYNTYMGEVIPLKDILGGLQYLDDKFNATMTYMRSSEFPIPYGGPYYTREHPLPANSTKLVTSRDKQKGHLVVWFVSNCQPDSFRMSYAKLLQKYIHMDIYGACGKKDPCSMNGRRNATCMTDLLRTYKFYLAFENGQCRDYITEKFWRTLDVGVVPVALGAWMEDYAALAPKDSFIHIDNFTGPEHLAQYLHYLDSHDEAYDHYLSWPLRSTLNNPHPQHTESHNCRWCSIAHNRSLLPRKTYKISEWFGPRFACRDDVQLDI